MFCENTAAWKFPPQGAELSKPISSHADRLLHENDAV